MSMNAALSGIQAAQSDISATSHNIANAATYGFRKSEVSFADVYNTSPSTVARTTVGSGTQVTAVSQNFAQGNIVTTGNQLDLAIKGQGFFGVQNVTDTGATAGQNIYSRSGSFTLDGDGMVRNAVGQALLGWPVSEDGRALSQTISSSGPLRIPLTMGQTVASDKVAAKVVLPTNDSLLGAQDAVPPTSAFSVDDPTSWAVRTSLPLTDASGAAIEGGLYFTKTAAATETDPTTGWQVHFVVDGAVLTPDAGADALTFDADGTLTSPTPMTFASASGEPFTLDLGGSRLEDRAFGVQTVSSNGAAKQAMTSVQVDETGTIWATYGSSEPIAAGKILLATFANPTGLASNGSAGFTATTSSGGPVLGAPGSMGFGALQSGSLEQSNVDLTSELVELITAQRNYQASAKALETSSSLMQTIMKITG